MSISAVALRAGVRRSTVYRHLPDEAALFRACSAHRAAQNPRPDPQVWASIASPNERLEVALIELYGFFHRTERMLDNLFRDETTVPAVRQRFGGAIGHAVAFSTWKSLVREQQLSNVEAAALMASAVSSAAGAKGRIR